jgi:hypothetical protein
MDDMALFSPSRWVLEEAREHLAEWLWNERRLRFKHPHVSPKSTKACFTYLGYRVSRAGIEPHAAMLRRMQRRVTERVLHGDTEAVERSIASYRGLLWRQFG